MMGLLRCFSVRPIDRKKFLDPLTNEISHVTHRFDALLLAIKPRYGSKHGSLSGERYFDFFLILAAATSLCSAGKVMISGRRQDIDGVPVNGYLTV